jgi:hypothetical protein
MNKALILASILTLTAVGYFYFDQHSVESDSFEQWKARFGTPFEPEE